VTTVHSQADEILRRMRVDGIPRCFALGSCNERVTFAAQQTCS
jgi:hypothetical protein